MGKVNFLDMHPLTFEEFLLAIGKNNLCDFLSQITLHDAVAQPIHEELLHWLKYYLYIGGMPEAIVEYCQSEQLSRVRDVHKEIAQAYLLDFAKHAPPAQVEKITTVWDMIPVQLAKENKKFIFSAIRKSARGRDYEEAIQWLTDAGLVYSSRLITTPKLPLKGYIDHGAFKLFALDTGLLAAMTHLSAKAILENNHLFSDYNGAFTENYVAQVLSANQIPLYYWKSNTAEVDFIVAHESDIYPLEVKTGFSTKKKSLLVYRDRYQPSHCARASQFNLKQDGWLCNYPLYLVHRFPQLQCT